MATYKSSVSIEQTPDVVFDYVSDVRNLPRYFAGLRSVEPLDGDAVRVTIDGSAGPVVLEAYFRVHGGHRRRVEWDTDDPAGYRGWLEVDPEGDVCSVTAEVHTHDEADVDAVIDRTLFALKGQIEGS